MRPDLADSKYNLLSTCDGHLFQDAAFSFLKPIVKYLYKLYEVLDICGRFDMLWYGICGPSSKYCRSELF